MFRINGNLRTATINGVANVVTGVDWICSAVSNLATAEVHGSTEFDYDAEAPFIQYENLSEDIVIGWVTSQLGEDAVAFYEERATTTANEYSEEFPEIESVLHVTCVYTPPLAEQAPPWAV